jgi:DNA modification methylase
MVNGNQKQPGRKRANDLDGKTWTRYSISIWSDIRKNDEELKLKHPAIFPLSLADRLIQCFTRDTDQVVLDPFAGTGSTIIAADRLGKKGIGIELSREFATLARKRLGQKTLWKQSDIGSVIYQGDASDLLKFVAPDSVDIVVTSPPYWNILTRKRTADNKQIRNYGEEADDLGKIQDYREFLKSLQHIFRNVYQVLRQGKFCIVVVMDLRQGATLYSFHSDVVRLMQEIGFKYDDMIIWDRRHEYNNMRPLGYPSVFRINRAHEFILIFQKPTVNLQEAADEANK